jgi:hypothetical protein
MDIIAFTWVHRNFRRWRLEYQPSLTGIDVLQVKHIPEERSIGFRVCAENNHMCTNDHRNSSSLLGGCQGYFALFLLQPTFLLVTVL